MITGEVLVSLIHSMAVVLMVAYFLTRAPWFEDVVEGRITWRARAKILAISGMLGVFGSMSGIHIRGAMASTRFIGPLVGGLLGGPLVGLGAGLISGAHRLLFGPAFTSIPTFIATVMAGVMGGAYHQVRTRRTGRQISMAGAALLAALVEACNSGLVLLSSRPLAKVWALQSTIAGPVLVANVLGTAIFFHFIQGLVRERGIRRQRDQFLAHKLKIEGELSVARDIQLGMVPGMAPGAAQWPACSLFADMRAAREVGGDFYDFFLDKEGKLVFTIGDVSDKGVPAALFMAMTRTLVRGMSEPGQMPHQLLARVNRELEAGNARNMFVTLFCGKLDCATGELWFSNAGHNPPLVVRRDGTVGWLELPPGLVLGAFASSAYTSERIVLAPGDSLVAYTDGVTEAMDSVGGMFTEGRLLETVRGLAGAGPRELVEQLEASVRAFVAGADPSDDLTLLAVAYTGA